MPKEKRSLLFSEGWLPVPAVLKEKERGRPLRERLFAIGGEGRSVSSSNENRKGSPTACWREKEEGCSAGAAEGHEKKTHATIRDWGEGKKGERGRNLREGNPLARRDSKRVPKRMARCLLRGRRRKGNLSPPGRGRCPFGESVAPRRKIVSLSKEKGKKSSFSPPNAPSLSCRREMGWKKKNRPW